MITRAKEKETGLGTALLIIVILAAVVLAVVFGGMLWGIRTQRRDKGVTHPRRRRWRRPAA
jgi:hypothetical protein